MKTIGRILIILVVFSILAGLMVTVVNASGATTSNFSGSRQFRPDGGGQRFRPGHDRGGSGGAGWIFGLVKNLGVMAIIVTLIAWPKSIAKKRKKRPVVNSSIAES
jgi:hypothetical protein